MAFQAQVAPLDFLALQGFRVFQVLAGHPALQDFLALTVPQVLVDFLALTEHPVLVASQVLAVFQALQAFLAQVGFQERRQLM